MNKYWYVVAHTLKDKIEYTLVLATSKCAAIYKVPHNSEEVHRTTVWQVAHGDAEVIPQLWEDKIPGTDDNDGAPVAVTVEGEVIY